MFYCHNFCSSSVQSHPRPYGRVVLCISCLKIPGLTKYSLHLGICPVVNAVTKKSFYMRVLIKLNRGNKCLKAVCLLCSHSFLQKRYRLAWVCKALQLVLEVSWNSFQQQLPCFWTKGSFCFFPVCLILWPQQ